MGGRNSGKNRERERLDKINEIWQMVCDHPSWEREKVIAKFQLNYGTSRRTTLDYMKVLENAGKIKW